MKRRPCPDHPAKRDDSRRPSKTKRGYGRRWEKVRASILTRDPICKRCNAAPSTEVDHIKNRREELERWMNGETDTHPDDPSNLQGLCKPCHSRKTATVG